jgi:hypothetical protein
LQNSLPLCNMSMKYFKKICIRWLLCKVLTWSQSIQITFYCSEIKAIFPVSVLKKRHINKNIAEISRDSLYLYGFFYWHWLNVNILSFSTIWSHKFRPMDNQYCLSYELVDNISTRWLNFHLHVSEHRKKYLERNISGE